MIHGFRTVALCLAEMQNEEVQELIFPLQRFLSERNWKTLIFNATTDMQQDTEFDRGERCVFGLIPYEKIDACVIHGRNIKNNAIIQEIVDRTTEFGKPVIILDCDTQFDNAINIVYEEQQAFGQLVRHLITEHNFKKINFIAGMEGNIVSERRYKIFRDVLDQYGIEFDEETQLGYGKFYDFPTIGVVEKFIENPQDLPEAIVCANDTMALTACDVLINHDIDVPKDIAVTGFDGIIREKYASPRLTTCRKNMYDLAEIIGNKILANADHAAETEVYEFPLWFDASESCGCRKEMIGHNRHAVSQLCAQTYDNNDYDRRMNQLLTKLNMAKNIRDMQVILRDYVTQDTLLCFNSEMDTDQVGYHWFNFNPFSKEMKAYRFFNDAQIERYEFPSSELVHDWKAVWSCNEPIVFMALHSQADCCGYMATLLYNVDVPSLLRDSEHAVRLAITLDSVISLHIQQSNMRRTNNKLKSIQDNIIAGFADLVESRDDSTGQHIKRTQEYISILVRNAAEKERYKKKLTPRTCELITKAAPLHDIGKITVSDTILNKPGKLTAEEFQIMQKHCEEGGRIIDTTLTGIEEPDYLDIARNVSVYHHEKWNGQGYPQGLKGDEIPICARMMAIVDVFDALSSKRVYKEAFSLEETFRIMEESRGSHFDPDLIDIFFEAKDEIVACFNSNLNEGAFSRPKTI